MFKIHHAKKERHTKHIVFVVFSLLFLFTDIQLKAQVTFHQRNPFKLSLRGGVLGNNSDLAAELRSKADNKITHTLNFEYAAIGEAELALEFIHFHGASLGIQVSGLYSHPEIKSKDPNGEHRVGLTQLEIARANFIVSFNGTDPYTMFELPYHSNKEAVLGICGMIIRTEKTNLTQYAKDTLQIRQIAGEYSQAVGVTFGWNWRLGESGWVIGLNGAVMFVINKSHLEKVTTEDSSPYYSGSKLDLAPRVLTAGLGYHF